MSGPANAVVGDQDEPTAFPETTVPVEELIEEKKLAKYSKTDEFKRLKEFMEDRVQFYQRYLPNGTMVQGDPKDPMKLSFPEGVSPEQLGSYWMAACIVIKEFENVLFAYAQAAEAVHESQ